VLPTKIYCANAPISLFLLAPVGLWRDRAVNIIVSTVG